MQESSYSWGVSIAQGVLPLVVRAGGGSVRDSLSLLDQLIAGSDADTVTYERALSLLGYTPAALLNEVVDAVAAIDRVCKPGKTRDAPWMICSSVCVTSSSFRPPGGR